MSAKIVQQKGHRFYTAIMMRDGQAAAEHIYAAAEADARARAGDGLRFLFVGKHTPIASDNGFMGPKTKRYAAVLADADGALRIEHVVGSSTGCVHGRANELGLGVALIFREGAETLRDVDEARREREERRRTAPRTLEEMSALTFGGAGNAPGFDTAHLERMYRPH